MEDEEEDEEGEEKEERKRRIVLRGGGKEEGGEGEEENYNNINLLTLFWEIEVSKCKVFLWNFIHKRWQMSYFWYIIIIIYISY